MSWDVMVLNIPAAIKDIDELPADFSSALGNKVKILSILKELFPQADFSDPSWVRLDGGDYTIEFSLGCEDTVDSMMLHVRGGDGPVAAIQNLCDRTSWRALDISSMDLIDFTAGNPGAGYEKWRQFRDKVIGKEV
jgi:hypothetical protein